MRVNKLDLKNKLSNIYKPKGVTSFDIVRQIKRITGEKKVGHAGTLDPLAEGVLVVGVGRVATKQLRFVLEEDKEYIGEIKLGMVSTTDDEEGEKTIAIASKAGPLERAKQAKGPAFSERVTNTTSFNDKNNKSQTFNCKLITDNQQWPTLKEIQKVTNTFIGDIIQISPVYSAIKIGGERAYKKARRGEKFTSPPRIVTIKEIEILEYQLKTFKEIKQSDSPVISAGEYPVLKIRAVVGSGTYIRSLAREIGEKLQTGGYLTSLIRTRIGNYRIEDVIRLEDQKDKMTED